MDSLYHIPKPNRNAACQDLVETEGVHFGYLRMKRKIHDIPIKVAFIKDIISKIKWDNKYVVVLGGCVYVYSGCSDLKPERSFSLFGFTQVMHVEQEVLKKKWLFKIICFIDERIKAYYFAASCEQEMNKWMIEMKKQMLKANNVTVNKDDLDETSRRSIEIPIMTKDLIKDLKNTKEFQDDLNDADSDDEYSYISTSTLNLNPPNIEKNKDDPQVDVSRKASLDSTSPPVLNPRSNGKSSSDTVDRNMRKLPNVPNSANVENPPNVPNVQQKPEKSRAEQINATADFINQQTINNRPHIRDKPKVNTPESEICFPSMEHKCKLSERPSLKVSPTLQKNLETESRWNGPAMEGQMLLVTNSYKGSYMIRKGTVEDNDVLLVLDSSQLKKFRIMKNSDESFCLDLNSESFESIHELIYFYRHNNLPNKDFKLTKAYTEL